MKSSQPWLVSPTFDLSLMLGPPFFITTLVLLFSNGFSALSTLPAVWWFIFIVGVDVSHVYSTMFRTYLDKKDFQPHILLYVSVPLIGWVIGCGLYFISAEWFWRSLAYLAVFHFMRQQYGWLCLYREKNEKLFLIDKILIYAATLYPLIYWHVHPRQFHWFIDNDFLNISWTSLSHYAGILYVMGIFIYFGKEFYFFLSTKYFNLPKNLLLIGTAFSWYIGIVYFNSDFVFTATNVISHGIPYLAWIGWYGYRRSILETNTTPTWYRYLFSARGWPFYLIGLCLLAYLEEGLWDGFVWREHMHFFWQFYFLPLWEKHYIWLIPLLSVPQITHYLLDAFIWRRHFGKGRWHQLMMSYRFF